MDMDVRNGIHMFSEQTHEEEQGSQCMRKNGDEVHRTSAEISTGRVHHACTQIDGHGASSANGGDI